MDKVDCSVLLMVHYILFFGTMTKRENVSIHRFLCKPTCKNIFLLIYSYLLIFAFMQSFMKSFIHSFVHSFIDVRKIDRQHRVKQTDHKASSMNLTDA